jgi:hypothetical protein
MMTPEQIQRTMDFIVQNHANAMIRMDRFDEELREQKKRVDQLTSSVSALTDHNNGVFHMIAEILASQSERLKWLEEKNQ